MRFLRKFAFGLAMFSVGAAAAVATLACMAQAPAKNDKTYEKLSVFSKVLYYVKNNYVDPVDEDRLIYGGIKGMLDTLDPHSVFLPPDVYKDIKIDTTGEFPGVGIQIDYDDNDHSIAVVSVFSGSPAERVGLKVGDRLVKIDGKDVRGLPIPSITQMLQGQIGTSVILTIETIDGGQKDFVLVRSIIKIPSVESKTLDDIGYVAIHSFQNDTGSTVRKIVNKWMGSGSKMRGIIVDMRNNPGGLLNEAVEIADLFIQEGTIVTVEGRNAALTEQIKSRKEGSFSEVPIVILMNGGAASASEVLAGALQDYNRAIIVGEQSYGKGSVQNIIDLEDGSALKLTVARYFTPKRRAIQGVGLTPDVYMPSPSGLLMPIEEAKNSLPDAQRKLLAPVKKEGVEIAGEDWQLLAAYNILSAKKN